MLKSSSSQCCQIWGNYPIFGKFWTWLGNKYLKTVSNEWVHAKNSTVVQIFLNGRSQCWNRAPMELKNVKKSLRKEKGHKAICQNITNANYHTFRFIMAFAVKTTPPVIHVFPHSFSFKKVFILKIS